ncbi:MAG: hypothetical protein LBR84_05345, partial [Tannerella sp.]|nr:hypothetical protein [Tannerella sp.]
GNELFVRTWSANTILRIYTPDAQLRHQRLLIAPALTTIPLPPGIYFITLNNHPAVKVVIE